MFFLCNFRQVVVDSRHHRDEVVTSPLANASQAPPPIGEVVTEIREDEEEPEDGEEEDEENQGDVPNDVVPSKPEKSSLGIEGIKIPSSERTQQKPPYSYAQLIVQALLASKERRQTLSSIYAYIADMYPYYKLEEKGWKVIYHDCGFICVIYIVCAIRRAQWKNAEGVAGI